jgi:hypothetical protein
VGGDKTRKKEKGETTNHDRVLFYAALCVLLFFEQGAQSVFLSAVGSWTKLLLRGEERSKTTVMTLSHSVIGFAELIDMTLGVFEC